MKSSKGKPVEPAPPETGDLSQRTWWIASGAIMLVAAFLRLYKLGLVPLHHDEGVNGNFLVRLVREGVYNYEPSNYHGPTLYYFSAVIPWLLKLFFGVSAQNAYGLNTVTIRLVPALFGLGTVWLALLLRRHLGSIATLAAAALLAISPGAVYLSRYFIHETLFVFFTLGIVVAALKYYEDGHPVYLILASASAALLFATKETAIISAGVLVIAFVSTIVYRRLMGYEKPGTDGRGRRKLKSAPENALQEFLVRAGGTNKVLLWAGVAVIVFVGLNVLFYSSFFTNYPKGVYDSLKAFQFWTKTGKEAHRHAVDTYVRWLGAQESPVLLLGAMGSLLALSRRSKAFALFCGLWGFGLIAAYSLIAYKTPWLVLSFLVPLALSSGFAIQWIYEELREWDASRQARLTTLALVLFAALGLLPGTARALSEGTVHWKTFIPGYQMIDLNFFNYDNDNRYYVYVYAHTRREIRNLVDEMDSIARRSHEEKLAGITIVSPDYWPLPWYLRDYTRVGYYGRMTASTEPMIIASEGQLAEMESRFGPGYAQVNSGLNAAGSYPLRPGVNLLLYVRKDLEEHPNPSGAEPGPTLAPTVPAGATR